MPLEPAIRNWRNFPPAGGWSVTYSIQGQSWVFTGSPKKIVAEIKNKQVVNGIYESDTAIWNYVNSIWCERDPNRCIQAMKVRKIPAQQPVRRDTSYRSSCCGGGRVR